MIRNIQTIFLLSLYILMTVANFSCRDDFNRVLDVETLPIEFENDEAVAVGDMLDLGESPVSDHGFCLAEKAGVTIADTKLSLGKADETGIYKKRLSGLIIGRTYFIRAFATNAEGIIYGKELPFKIEPTTFTVTTDKPVLTSDTSLTIGGHLMKVGSLKVLEYGHCWDTLPNPTIKSLKTDFGITTKDTLFSSSASALKLFKTYYFRSYAVLDSNEVVYGNEESIEIMELKISTDSVKVLSSTEVEAYGSVLGIGFTGIVDHGHCWSTSPNPTVNDSKTTLGTIAILKQFKSTITNLQIEKDYYYRAYAMEGLKIKYGNIKQFKIADLKVDLDSLKMINSTNIKLYGTIMTSFSLDDYGFCWSTNLLPTINDGIKSFGKKTANGTFSFNTEISGLKSNVFYFRSYVTKNSNIYYSDTSISFIGGDTWKRKTDFNKLARSHTVGFSIGNKGFIGLGYSDKRLYDLWSYDAEKDVWTQKADFQGIHRVFSSVFVINENAYILTGDIGGENTNDVWEYSYNLNSWIRKNDFPGVKRYGATGFTYNNKGYIISGINSSVSPVTYLKDFWEYSYQTDSWLKLNDFPGDSRCYAISFIIENNLYFGLGDDTIAYNTSDFWQYNFQNKIWNKKSNFPGNQPRFNNSFVIHNKGYIVAGWPLKSSNSNELWQYNPSLDIWIRKSDLFCKVRYVASTFVLNNKAYFGTGSSDPYELFSDFWEYTPE